MSERFASHQVEHLFVLVGANPLPNYVAARLLMGSTSHLHLVVSRQTEGVADRLRDVLKASLMSSGAIISLPPINDPSDVHEVGVTVERYLKDSVKAAPNDPKKPGAIIGRIGLHYTSGTKPMALESHRTLAAWCHDQPSSELHLSYLDPRHLSLRFETEEVRLAPDECLISFPELLELHGAKPGSSKLEPELPQVCRHLVQYLGGGQEALEEWRRWCDHHLRTWHGVMKWQKSWDAFQEMGRGKALVGWVGETEEHIKALQEWSRWVQTNSLKEKKADLSWVRPHKALIPHVATLEEWRQVYQDATGWTESNDGFTKMAKFLDGQWLESYVLDCIQPIAKTCSLHSVQRGIEVTRQSSSATDLKPFEFDVVAMRGYQLFALSCTTDGRENLNKSKLFEIFTRAHQMGGDEARFGLVCGAEDAEAVRREIEAAWQAPHGSVRVFGRQEWATLSARLQEWFLD